MYQISKEGGCREKLDHWVKRKLCMCVFVCVGGRACVLTIFYSPQVPMGLEPLLPQINMTEQSESLCKRQIIFENHLEPTLGFDIGTE